MQIAYSIYSLYKKKMNQFIFTMFLSFFIIGCTSSSQNKKDIIEQQITNEWLINKSLLEKVQVFETLGKVSFRNKKQSISANFQWQQNENNLSLRLTNFFGSTILRLTSNEQGTTIIDHQGKSHFGSNMGKLIQSLTGVDLPINELVNWLKALPNSNNTFQLNSQHTLAHLTQYPSPRQNTGWQISYQNYRQFNNLPLPLRINMNNKNQQVNIAISQWIL